MPQYIVTSPEGVKYKVNAPEGATQDEVMQYIQQNAVTPTSDQTSGFERFGRGVTDLATGLVQSAVNAGFNPAIQPTPEGSFMAGITAERDPTKISQEFNRTTAEQEANYQAKRGDNANRMDWMRVLGNIAGAAPLAFVPGGQTALGNIGMGAGVGAASAFTQPVYEGNFWQEKMQQMGTGAIAGGAGSALVSGLGRALSPQVDDAARMLQERGVRLTPGQMIGPNASAMEQRVTGVVPFVGDARRRAVEDFNVAAINEALAPIGQSVDKAGRQGIRQARQAISKSYDDVLSQITFKADDVFNAELASLKDLATDLNKQQADDFARIIKNEVENKLGQTGIVDGKTFKGIESVLNKKTKDYLRSGDYNENQLGNALKEALNSLRGALTRGNPEAANVLSKVNQSRAIFESVRTASTGAGAKSGYFTPDRLMSAIARTDPTKGKQMMSEGGFQLQRLAEAGQEIIGNTIPNSGTPERLVTQAAMTGGLGFINPALAAGVGAGSLLYTKPGQRIAQSLLMGNRPTWLRGTSNALMRSAIPAAAGAGLLAGSQ
jgi:hypothetical protein